MAGSQWQKYTHRGNYTLMDYGEALAFIHGANRFGEKLGLENMRELTRRLGNPQEMLNCIHVAGTNGKGSVVAFLLSIFIEAGYVTGAYTSPYLHRFNERIRVNGESIPDGDLARLVGRVKSAIEGMTGDGFNHPTEFEVVTAVAFLYYAEMDCDVVILEVGMGGRYDSTNVISSPIAAVITTIGYDHMEYLGGTLEEIAYEKAGIMKGDCDVVLYPQTDSVRKVFAEVADSVGARIRSVNFSQLKGRYAGASGLSGRHGANGLSEIHGASGLSGLSGLSGWHGANGQSGQSGRHVVNGPCGQSEKSGPYVANGPCGPYGQVFDYKGYDGLRISLLGDFQLRNAAMAIETVDLINSNPGIRISTPKRQLRDIPLIPEKQPLIMLSVTEKQTSKEHSVTEKQTTKGFSVPKEQPLKGFSVTEKQLREGLAKAKWPGRMELALEDPPFIIDAAHNPQCAEALIESLQKYFPGKRAVFIFGALHDKDIDSIIKITMPMAYAVFAVAPDSPRALPASELVRKLSGSCGRVFSCGSVPEAVQRGTECAKTLSGAFVCAFGSLYYIGHVRECLGLPQ